MTEHRNKIVDRTDAIRLALALQNWRCPGCGANQPRVTHTELSVRSIRCRMCDFTDKLAVPAPETP